MVYEFKFDGVLVFYFWFVEGIEFGYLVDICLDFFVLKDFCFFVDEVIDYLGVEKIYFIVYGVGVCILLLIFDEIGKENLGWINWFVDEVILSVLDMMCVDFLSKVSGVGKVVK